LFKKQDVIIHSVIRRTKHKSKWRVLFPQKVLKWLHYDSCTSLRFVFGDDKYRSVRFHFRNCIADTNVPTFFEKLFFFEKKQSSQKTKAASNYASAAPRSFPLFDEYLSTFISADTW